MMDTLFLELVRVSVGVADALSREPAPGQWEMLYDMAQKQSLVGVCFAGVWHLRRSGCQVPEMLYLRWMATTCAVMDRNRQMDAHCAKVQELLAARGFRSTIIKGQPMAAIYPKADFLNESLSSLRQAGDIDVWVDGSRSEIIAAAASLSSDLTPVADHHVGGSLFDGVPVEFHFSPGSVTNPLAIRPFERWSRASMDEQMTHRVTLASGVEVFSPTAEFNIVLALEHMLKHVINGGVGLRQVMDFYYLLKDGSLADDSRKRIAEVVDSLRITGFAGAMAWILGHVFSLDASLMIWTPDERRGRFILEEIERGGNFGKYDDTYAVSGKGTKFSRFLKSTWYARRFMSLFPEEALWYPVGRILNFIKSQYRRFIPLRGSGGRSCWR